MQSHPPFICPSQPQPWVRSLGPLHVCLNRQWTAAEQLQRAPLSPQYAQVQQFTQQLFLGEHLNHTENRAAGHWSLRWAQAQGLYPSHVQLQHQGQDHLQLALLTQRRQEAFVEDVHQHRHCNPDGQPYTDVLHLGIGGSDLGPRLLYHALAQAQDPDQKPARPRLRMHCVSNLDQHELARTLPLLNPKTTLVVVASKSFSTQETLLNFEHIRQWLHTAGPNYADHAWVAATCQPNKAMALGIAKARVFEFSETVGGRYSVWGPVSMGVRLAYGNAVLNAVLQGAAKMDAHILQSEAHNNIPFLLAYTDWYNLQLGVESLMLSAYDSRLGLLVPYIQQLWMESLGKGVNNAGKILDGPACPIVWGDVGTNAQHAFFQLLHQGPHLCGIELLAIAKPQHTEHATHQVLLANVLAQAQAFATGQYNSDNEKSNSQVNHKTCPGKRPVSLMWLDELTPNSLGLLLALWEHRTVFLAAMQNINPFDQWGVELGKHIAQTIQNAWGNPQDPQQRQHGVDDTTANLMHLLKTTAPSRKTQTNPSA